MKTIQLGSSDLHVTPICLGTMVFGEQVDEPTSHAILSHSLERGINFIDTAEMYAVPPRAETFNLTEKFIGNWIKANPTARDKLVIATKVAGPSRGMDWVRGGSSNLTAADIVGACEGSLKRMNIEVIDLYQIHWPVRHVPMFGGSYYNPATENVGGSSIEEQLRAMDTLVKAGKVRAIGLSNETSYGVHEFVRVAEQHGLPRIATVQNNYSLLARTVENGLDETMHRLGVSLLPYSPLAFGLLTGKYDAQGLMGADVSPDVRLRKFESTRKQRWGRPEALVAARRYNALAQENGMTPSQMALAFCYTKWQVASTIIGVRTLEQLDENIDAWGTRLSPELLKQIDAIRWEIRDPAL
ncbi:MAG: aldo/keto reductase [Rhodoferax sp.]|nr:aldo/keto reductase [Rhodoferax sp.]